MVIGLLMGDSENLLAPIALIGIGAWLMRDVIRGQNNVEM